MVVSHLIWPLSCLALLPDHYFRWRIAYHSSWRRQPACLARRIWCGFKPLFRGLRRRSAVPVTIIGGSIVTRSISAAVCGNIAVVGVRWGVSAVIVIRGIAAIMAVPRSAIVPVTRAIAVGAGR